jgi:hypothetical protein
LTRDCEYSDDAAKNIVGAYRDTFEYAQLELPAIIPAESPMPANNTPSNAILGDTIRGTGRGISKGPQMERTQTGETITLMPMPEAFLENDIKVLLDGDRLRVSAYVDSKGVKRLLKAITANAALLDDEDGEG